jgi:hypothetical protein
MCLCCRLYVCVLCCTPLTVLLHISFPSLLLLSLWCDRYHPVSDIFKTDFTDFTAFFRTYRSILRYIYLSLYFSLSPFAWCVFVSDSKSHAALTTTRWAYPTSRSKERSSRPMCCLSSSIAIAIFFYSSFRFSIIICIVFFDTHG